MTKKFYATVENYLSKKDNTRPVLRTIQRNKTGQQFILDGFTAYVFKKHVPEFDALPQMGKHDPIGIEHILPRNPQMAPASVQDCNVWKNIPKFAGYLKSVDEYNRDTNPVHIFGKLFSARMIAVATEILGNKIETFSISQGKPLEGVLIETPDIDAFLLPLRFDGEKETNTVEKRTQAFVASLNKSTKEAA